MKKIIIMLLCLAAAGIQARAIPNIYPGDLKIVVTNFNGAPTCFNITDGYQSIQQSTNSLGTYTGIPNELQFYSVIGYGIDYGAYGVGIILDNQICYEIKPCDWVPGDPVFHIKLNIQSNGTVGGLVINFDQVNRTFSVSTTNPGNTAKYSVGTCRFCFPDVYLGPDPAFATPLTESSTFIETVPNLIVEPSANVKLDANPTGYILLNEGFYSDPTTC